jgi:hypothetical protein
MFSNETAPPVWFSSSPVSVPRRGRGKEEEEEEEAEKRK